MARWNIAAIKALYGSGKPPKPRSKKSSTKAKGGCESESIAQQRLVAWMNTHNILHFAIPNGANVAVHHRQKLVKEGLVSGVPDLMIPIARKCYNGMFLELKRADGGAGLSAEQEKWLIRLNFEGYLAICCKGFDQAKEKIAWYVSIAE